MKQLVVLAGYAIALLGIVGCQNANRQGNDIEVIIEDDGQFPEFLVGTWQADEHGWEFVFEPDGTISSAVVALGNVRLKPGQVTEVPTKLGGKAVFEPGQWLVHYAPALRELTVRISLKNFYIEMGGGVLDGKGTDILVGKVSDDGKSWQVEWTTYPDYTAHTAKHPNFRLPDDKEHGILRTLVFKKVEPD